MSDEKPTPGYARVNLAPWAMSVPEIAELVKAVHAMREAMRRDSYTTDDKGERVPDAFRHLPETHRVDAALKPFEGP